MHTSGVGFMQRGNCRVLAKSSSPSFLAALQGFPVSGPGALWSLLFHGGLLAILALYILFWVKLNLMQASAAVDSAAVLPGSYFCMQACLRLLLLAAGSPSPLHAALEPNPSLACCNTQDDAPAGRSLCASKMVINDDAGLVACRRCPWWQCWACSRPGLATVRFPAWHTRGRNTPNGLGRRDAAVWQARLSRGRDRLLVGCGTWWLAILRHSLLAVVARQVLGLFLFFAYFSPGGHAVPAAVPDPMDSKLMLVGVDL
jgi:hypothetical protein